MRKNAWLLISILILALALRLFRLNSSPLWWDEGNSVYFADLLAPSQVLAETIATHDTTPPVYRLALGLWARAAGFSPFAVRAFSAFWGMLSVWAIWIWGRWLGGYRMGVIAAALVAVSPALVQHSREAKGYSMLVFLALLQGYIWARGLGYLRKPSSREEGSRLPWAIAYIVLTTLVLGTHYYSIPFIAVQNLWVMADWGSRASRIGFRSAAGELGRWLALQVGSAFLLLPWVLAIWRSTLEGLSGASSIKSPLEWYSYGHLVLTYLLGSPFGVSQGVMAATTAMVLACTAIGFRALGRRPAIMLACWALVPFLIAYPLQRIYPFFYPRLLLYTLPAWHLLAAAGIQAILPSMPGKAIALGLAVCLGYSLLGLYGSAIGMPEEDYRPLISDLRSLASPGDAVLLTYPWQIGYLKSYAPQLCDAVTIYRNCCPSATMPGSLQGIVDRHRRVWLITYRIANDDPHEVVGRWLNSHALCVFNSWYGVSQLALFTKSEAAEGKWHADWKRFGDCMVFLGYDLDSATVEPGGRLSLTLYWRALRPMEDSYTIFTHLVDADGHIWGQWDNPPMQGSYPTTEWEAEEFIPDKYEIPVRMDTPAGEYRLEVGVYNRETMERLPVFNDKGERLPDDRVLLESKVFILGVETYTVHLPIVSSGGGTRAQISIGRCADKVHREEDKLVRNGKEIRLVGVNATWLTRGDFPEERWDEVLSFLSKYVNCVRIWVFPGTDLDKLERLLDLGAKYDLLFGITFETFQEVPEYSRFDQRWFAEGYKQTYLPFVKEVVSRFKGSSQIAFWQMMNEPNPWGWPWGWKGSGIDTFERWIRDVAAEIRAIDPCHPISIGLISVASIGNNVDPERWIKEIHTSTEVDLITAHVHKQQGKEEIELANEIGYPIVFTEVWINRSSNVEKRRDWVLGFAERRFRKGLDGLLLWQFKEPTRKYPWKYEITEDEIAVWEVLRMFR